MPEVYSIEPVDGFPFVHEERVRWRDLDGFGHVNNAVYLTYLEQSRFAYLEHLGLVDGLRTMTMILARVQIDFRSPLGAGDVLRIGVRPARLGTKSFELEHEIRADGRVAAEAKSVLVAYDYGRAESVPLSESLRARLSEAR